MQKHTQTNRRPETSEKEAKRDFFFQEKARGDKGHFQTGKTH